MKFYVYNNNIILNTKEEIQSGNSKTLQEESSFILTIKI